MHKLFVLLIFIASNFPLQAQFNKILKQVKETVLDEGSGNIGLGLKEALEVGVGESVKSLSTKNGYFESPYKILIPEEAQKVVSAVSKIPGFNNVEKDLLAKMNEAAELAAKKATPIFVKAIKGITFKDATQILMGEQNAATKYLESSARTDLYSEFLPVIQVALDEVNAREYWTSIVTKYNSLPLTKDVNPRLDDHVNNKALDGLFSLIEVKEKGIREDVGQRTSPLLKDVFSKQDKKN
jgi:hypothetical protein